MELPLLPSTSSSSSTIVGTQSSSTPLTTPSPSARTILSVSGRLPTSPVIGRKSSKKQIVAVEGVDAITPVSGTNVRSVLSSPSGSNDGSKPPQQQILMGGRLISSTAGRKSLVMTSSSGMQQVVRTYDFQTIFFYLFYFKFVSFGIVFFNNVLMFLGSACYPF